VKCSCKRNSVTLISTTAAAAAAAVVGLMTMTMMLMTFKYPNITIIFTWTCPWHCTRISQWALPIKHWTLLVLDSARRHTAISRFHVRRPTSIIVRLQSPDQLHRTDYQQQSGHFTLCRISRTNWKLTSSDGPWIGLHVTARKKLTFYYYYFYF